MKNPSPKPAVQRVWWKRGFTCNLQMDPAGKRWAAHAHAVDEIVRVVDGQIVVHDAGKARRLKAGQELVVPAKTLHHIENPTRHQAMYFYGFRNKRKTKN